LPALPALLVAVDSGTELEACPTKLEATVVKLLDPTVNKKVVVVVTVSMMTETAGQTEGVILGVVEVYIPPAVLVWSVVGAMTELAWGTIMDPDTGPP
jgi:hypothetical protein